MMGCQVVEEKNPKKLKFQILNLSKLWQWELPIARLLELCSPLYMCVCVVFCEAEHAHVWP